MTPALETVSADEQLAKELVERARSEGVQLVGPGGLLTDPTKTVLETALEVERRTTSAIRSTPPRAAAGAILRNGTRSKTVVTEVGEVDIEVPRDRDGWF